MPVSLKQAPEEAQPEFDQILDLSNDATVSAGGALNPPPATPLIAFEDSINSSPKQEVPTSGNLELELHSVEISRFFYHADFT